MKESFADLIKENENISPANKGSNYEISLRILIDINIVANAFAFDLIVYLKIYMCIGPTLKR